MAEGARVAIVDRDPRGADVASSLRAAGHDVAFFRADLTAEDDVRAAVAGVVAAFGGIDTLIGCAGISGPVGTPLAAVELEAWEQVMAVNVRGNYLVAKHAVGHVETSRVATFVFIASDSAFVAFDGMGPYTASKGAVVALTKALAVDYPRVRANALCPGIVDTPMSRSDLGLADGFDASGLPVAAPGQLAKQAVFLASPASAPVNATTLVSDFGYLARSAVGALAFVEEDEAG